MPAAPSPASRPVLTSVAHTIPSLAPLANPSATPPTNPSMTASSGAHCDGSPLILATCTRPSTMNPSGTPSNVVLPSTLLLLQCDKEVLKYERPTVCLLYTSPSPRDS